MFQIGHVCWFWAVKILPLKPVAQFKPLIHATLLIANFMQTVPVKSSDFLMFRVCFKASMYIKAEINYGHIKCRCLVSLSLNHPRKSIGLLLLTCGSSIRPFANGVQNDWGSKFQSLPSVKLRVYNCFVLPDGYFGL